MPGPDLQLKEPPAYSPRRPVRNASKLEALQKDAERKAGYRSRKRIAVANSLDDLHPLVSKTRDALQRAKPDKANLLEPGGIRALDVRVSEVECDRAMCILNAFVRAAEAQGMPVKIASREKRRSWLVYDGEQIDFWLSEDIARTEHKPTKAEKQKIEDWWERRDVPRWDEIPSGRLRFRIAGSGTMRSTWSDTTRNRLEDTLDAVIRAVRRVPAERAKARVAETDLQRELAEQHRRRQDEEQRRAARRQAAAREKRHADRLRELVRRWRDACDIRAYADAMEAAAAPNGSELLPHTDEARSLQWIRAYADRVDPLVPSAGEPLELEIGHNPWASDRVPRQMWG